VTDAGVRQHVPVIAGMHIWGSSLFVLEEYAGEPFCKRRIRDEEILRMELNNNTDAEDIGDLSGKLETVNLNAEKVEFGSVEMRDYSNIIQRIHQTLKKQ
jgi:hypothetical protein